MHAANMMLPEIRKRVPPISAGPLPNGSTMSRDDGWRFLALGQSLERVDMTARLLIVRVGLPQGADDWVTKPCHPEELIARVEAVVRRRKRADVRVEKGPTVVGEVEIRDLAIYEALGAPAGVGT